MPITIRARPDRVDLSVVAFSGVDGIYDESMSRPIRSSRTSGTRQELRGLRIAAIVLLITFCALVAVITFWPGPPDPDGQDALKDFLARAHAAGSLLWITFGRVEFGANILLFVPIGLFGALSLRRAHWLVVPAAILASAAIEVIQAARFPERDGTPRDVIANGIGALIGYVIAELVLLAARRRSRLAADRSVPATVFAADG